MMLNCDPAGGRKPGADSIVEPAVERCRAGDDEAVVLGLRHKTGNLDPKAAVTLLHIVALNREHSRGEPRSNVARRAHVRIDGARPSDETAG